MTQLDDELEEAVWAEHHAEDSDGASGNDGYHDFRDEGFDDASPNFSFEDDERLEELIEDLQGMPAKDTIEEAKEALKKSGREPTDANLLAVLLKIFRAARDAALEGNGTWDCAVSYCDTLTGLCDRNFALGGNSSGFPASFVGIVYAECGRTLLLADQLKLSRELLEKSVYVFGLISESGDETTQRQNAAASASLARVIRRLNGVDAAREQFLKALQIYSNLPGDVDTLEFLSETCQVLGEMQEIEVSSTALGLLAEIAEDKFGTGSEEHLQLLKQIAATCTGLGKPEMAAPALACRARVLQESSARYGGTYSFSEVCSATEEAAAALEAALPAKLQQGDLEGAIAVWEEAIVFRELLEGPEAKLVKEMQKALQALRQALDRQGSSSEGQQQVAADEEEAIEGDAAVDTPVDCWEDDVEEANPSEAASRASKPKEQEKSPNQEEASFTPPVRLTSSLLVAPGSLRPAWMKESPKAKPAAKTKSDSPSEDAW